ncbi:MAG: hypothetical protein HY549_03130 [Elusimicrobia bacterium]|nr:hypothetical protein [Elusimicrobiota bacterium]
MRKATAILTAIVYLGLSNYCLTYAVMTGESHCLPNSTSQAHTHGEHEHDADHDGHGEAPSHHDHPSDSSDPCCVTVSALTIPSSPQLLSKASIAPIFLYVVAVETTLNAENYFRRTDHGPPKAAGQEAFLSYRASRAPPTLS